MPDRNGSPRSVRAYRFTMIYTAIMVTVAVVLLLLGGHS